jgi:hypothetical protein
MARLDRRNAGITSQASVVPRSRPKCEAASPAVSYQMQARWPGGTQPPAFSQTGFVSVTEI